MRRPHRRLCRLPGGGHRPGDRYRRGVFLEELCAVSEDAYAALWTYLLGIDLTEELRTRGRPIDEPLRYMLEDQRQLRTASWGDRTWVRLVDIPEALSLRRYEEEGELVLEVDDPFCPWNGGRFRLSVDGAGSAVVERVGAAPDLVLPAAVLGALYLGGAPFAGMAEVGRVEERVDGSARRCRPDVPQPSSAVLHVELLSVSVPSRRGRPVPRRARRTQIRSSSMTWASGATLADELHAGAGGT